MSTITIGFVPRERFALAAEALQRIFEVASSPFNLIVVDCNIPEPYRQEMENVLKGRDNVSVIRTDHFLLPNQAKNLVIRETKTEFLCLIENDNLVQDHWLDKLLAACQQYPADVAIPFIMEGRPGESIPHFDDNLGRVQSIEGPDGLKLEVLPRQIKKEKSIDGNWRAEEFMETHCLLFRKSVFDRIGSFDKEINTSEEVDLSLALYHGNVRAVFVPKCVIHYILPTYPLPAKELDYFLLKWNIKNARRSHHRISDKWNLARFPQLMGFVEERNLKGQGQLKLWREELTEIISPEALFILVGLEEWIGNDIVDGLRVLPFLERDGNYWGAPENDDVAIEEVQRMKKMGASFIVFAWHTFWYLEHYLKFSQYLRSNFTCIIQNDHFLVFDLRQSLKT